jgi:hypothetical protein
VPVGCARSEESEEGGRGFGFGWVGRFVRAAG